MAAFSGDFDWMGTMGETEPKSQKGKKKGKKKGFIKRWREKREKRNSQKRIANNLRKMEKRRIECEKKGKKLSLNGKDCEEITPQPSSTAYSNNRASISSAGIEGYLDSLRREEQNRINNEARDLGAETPSDDESEWSDYDVTDADRLAADMALGRVKRGGKRRRKRRRKTHRKKKGGKDPGKDPDKILEDANKFLSLADPKLDEHHGEVDTSLQDEWWLDKKKWNAWMKQQQQQQNKEGGRRKRRRKTRRKKKRKSRRKSRKRRRRRKRKTKRRR
tara:strand:- start:8229 stop:9056 length:828 start_codon:yes stop_codon:yes gene_type:complete